MHSGRVTFPEFHDQIFAGLNAILADAERNPLKEAIPAPKDWPALQAVVRSVAEEMALCSTLDAAIARLKADPAALLGSVWLATHVPGPDVLLAEKLAYAGSPQDSSMLPGYPLAAFLMELCDGLELRPKD